MIGLPSTYRSGVGVGGGGEVGEEEGGEDYGIFLQGMSVGDGEPIT